MPFLNNFWGNQKHYLNRMTLRELTIAYFQYPAVQTYIVLLGVSIYLAIPSAGQLKNALGVSQALAVIVAILVYPLIWYLLHRYILHGRFLYRSPKTAAVWKRIHFDHHQDPNNLGVLFGALYTTLPTVALVTISIGYLIGGMPGAWAAFATGLATTLFYEFCHCIQHLHYLPKSKFLRKIKRLHLLHHFHNETGNFGITNYFWDRLIGTFYNQSTDVPASPTVFNLGYHEEECHRYPWVAELSKDTP